MEFQKYFTQRSIGMEVSRYWVNCVCLVMISVPLLVFSRDLQRIGVSLAGHQKKILTSVQLMRHNVDDQSPTESV